MSSGPAAEVGAAASLVTGLAAGSAVLLLLPGRPRVATLRSSARRSRSAAGPGRPTLARLAGAAMVGVAVAVLVGGEGGAVAGCPGALLTWWWVGRLEPSATRRRRELLAAALPLVVDLMASCLTAGVSVTAALDRVAAAVGAPMRDELELVSSRLRLGADPVTVWAAAATHPQLGALSRAVARAVESGASVAEAMVRLSDDLRGRADAEVEARARAVGVKAAVPLGVCLLPSFVLVGVVPLVAGSLAVLLHP